MPLATHPGLSAFAIGTTEFVIMGLLPDVAADLSVSIPGAGWLVTGYALGVAIGARSWPWPPPNCRARPRWWR
jgi:MFS family permease